MGKTQIQIIGSKDELPKKKKKIEKFSKSREGRVRKGRTQIQILEPNHELPKKFFLKNFLSPKGEGCEG